MGWRRGRASGLEGGTCRRTSPIRNRWSLKPEHQKISAYYNIDNGTGRIHGVWMQGNLAVVPVFEEWIMPLL